MTDDTTIKITRKCDSTSHTGTPWQCVTWLWETAFVRDKSPEIYMAQVAWRVMQYNGYVVNIKDGPSAFLEDLAWAGIIEIDEVQP
jgi:hypothetical protein